MTEQRSTTSGSQTQTRGPLSQQGSEFEDLLSRGVQTALGGAPSEALSGIPGSFGTLNQQFATALETGELPNNIFGGILSDFGANQQTARNRLLERQARIPGFAGTPLALRELAEFDANFARSRASLSGDFLQNFLTESGTSLTNIFNAANQTLGLGLQGAVGGLNAAVAQQPVTTTGSATTEGGGSVLGNAAAIATLGKLVPDAIRGVGSILGGIGGAESVFSGLQAGTGGLSIPGVAALEASSPGLLSTPITTGFTTAGGIPSGAAGAGAGAATLAAKAATGAAPIITGGIEGPTLAAATAAPAGSLSGLAGAAAVPLAAAGIIGAFTGKGLFNPSKPRTPAEAGEGNLFAAAQLLGGNDVTPEGFKSLLGEQGFNLFNFLQDPTGAGGIGNRESLLSSGMNEFQLNSLLAKMTDGTPQTAIKVVADFLGIATPGFDPFLSDPGAEPGAAG